MNLVAEVGFDQSFSFSTAAGRARRPRRCPTRCRTRSSSSGWNCCSKRLNAQARAISQRMVGSRQRVLVERPAKRNPRQLAGRTDNNRWVNFDGPPATRSPHQPLRDVIITEAMPNSLRGRLAGAKRGCREFRSMTRDVLLAPADNVRWSNCAARSTSTCTRSRRGSASRCGGAATDFRSSAAGRDQARRSGAAGPVRPRAARAGGFRARAHRLQELDMDGGGAPATPGRRIRRIEGAHRARRGARARRQSDRVPQQCAHPRPDVRHRSRGHGQDLSGGGLRGRGAAIGEGAAHRAGAAGGRSGRAAGLPARRSVAEGRSVPAARCTTRCTR
jgi:hypothetical protein